MRLWVALWLTVGWSVALYGQTDSSGLGDVRYSLLDEQQFRDLNGKGWVLMKGQGIDGTDTGEVTMPSDLFKKTGLKRLPDARGVFIRGMNGKRRSDSGDPDSVRKVGSPQADAIRKHTHLLHNQDSRTLNSSTLTFASASKHPTNNVAGATRDLPYTSPTEEAITIQDTGHNLDGPETRPKNIALYVYVKINYR